MKKALEEILGAPLTDSQWVQASLPISKGGLGLRSAERHSSVAFLASLVASQPLVEFMRGEGEESSEEEVTVMEAPELIIAPGGSVMREDVPLPVSLPMEEELTDLNSQLGDQLLQEQVLSMTQRELSSMVDTESHHRLLQSTTSTRELARLHCLERDWAGDWLGALPCKSLGLHLRRSEFIVAAR